MAELIQALPAKMSEFSQLCGAALAILLVAGVGYLIIARGLKSLQQRRHLPEQLILSLRRIIFWGILLTTGLLMLQVLGILHSVIAAVTGVLALLAIGFVAVWSVLSNTLCSLILMIMRPYRVGDTLSLPPDNLEGKVVNFNLIFTTLETEDGYLLQIPNNLFFQRPVVRKVGKWRIGLADQLYESKNATGERKPEVAATEQGKQAA